MLTTIIVTSFIGLLFFFVLKTQLRLWQTEERLWEKTDELELANKQLAGCYRDIARPSARPARIKLAGAMSAEQIEQTLRGTKDSPLVKALEAHVSMKLIEASDMATDRPAVMVAMPDRIIQPYTMEDRLHDSGKASALGDLLSFIQEVTKSEEQSPEKSNVA